MKNTIVAATLLVLGIGFAPASRALNWDDIPGNSYTPSCAAVPAPSPAQAQNADTGGCGSKNNPYFNSLSPNLKAFLDMVAYAEGTGDAYNMYYHGALIENNCVDHPRKSHTGLFTSQAAGRYQILPKYWDKLAGRLGLSDFSAENQDRAAVEFIREKGMIGVIDSIRIGGGPDENFTAAVTAMGAVWMSLPGSPIKQTPRSKAEVWNAYVSALNNYSGYND